MGVRMRQSQERGAYVILTTLDTIHERQRIAKRIRDARVKRGMTQDEFAAVSNMGGRTIISKYEMGIRVPSVINGLRIAKTLGMTMDELFGDKG